MKRPCGSQVTYYDLLIDEGERTHDAPHLAIGWRRCHSQMVWQAMVAVAMVAVAAETARMDAWDIANESRALEASRDDWDDWP